MKRHKFKYSFAKKNIILVAVTLILVTMTVIGTSISWIEDVSKVEFNNNSGQETPHHITDKILKADIVSKKPSLDAQTGVEQINTVSLDQYFNASGDMHLSPCYGDGEKFYFPVEGGAVGEYREGNKDDVNVNYLSTTFRIKSEDADTVYWFEKSGENNDTSYVSFRKGDGNTNTSLSEYLRCSITVDGATQVYALNSDGSYRVSASGSAQNGRRIDKYTYFQEKFNSDGTPNTTANNAAVNMGASGTDLNGNILFTVPKYVNSNSIKTVTVKLWLEAGSYTAGTGVDIADLNLNIVSSWAKKRRIYVQDNTVDEWDSAIGNTGTNWLGNSGAKLYWAVDGSSELVHFDAMTGPSSNRFYVDLPAVYNNVKTYLYRCNDSWGVGNSHSPDINYWDKWTTVFPNTFHSETFYVYSHKYATWESGVKKVKFINSAGVNNLTALTQPTSYMWASATDIIQNGTRIGSVVENKEWPGQDMTRLNETVGPSGAKQQVWAFFYTATFDKAVFNDGRGGTSDSKGLQTQDLTVKATNIDHSNDYFDMATLKWFTSSATKPTYTANNYLEIDTNQEEGITSLINFTYGGKYSDTNGNNEICRVYAKSSGQFKFKVKIDNDYYGNNGGNYNWVNWQLKKNENAIYVNLSKGVHRFYLIFNNGTPFINVVQNADTLSASGD